MKQAADPLLGQIYAGRFRIEARVGTGGMGTVYRAVQIGMDRPVALKVLRPEYLDDEEVRARFDREMRATVRIDHPNTATVYEYGHTDDGASYLVMELLRGRGLDEVMAEAGPLEHPRVAWIGQQVAAALGAAHAEGIVHRDLKPENVMLLDRYEERDRVKVLDFGLARLLEGEDDPQLTALGARVGTPLYMAPEYVSGERGDHRMDLYALGVILFEMVTGEPPFQGGPYQVMQKHVEQAPPRPERCPTWLADVILALLEKDPARRPQTAAEVKKALETGRVREEITRDLPPQALPAAVTAPAAAPRTEAASPWRMDPASPLLAAVAVLIGLGLVSLGWLLARWALG